ncbi:hypothetical protein CLAIMM_02589 isoform 2 [Cladophialophora immunda]|nr:hypothetical protein CLAIMM_02589 isoform 1 [Cladophialophora immunda]OQU96519.1 hypothetical protein CLAIMM_02589 isoform 2 [Cladophialophora immunda]
MQVFDEKSDTLKFGGRPKENKKTRVLHITCFSQTTEEKEDTNTPEQWQLFLIKCALALTEYWKQDSQFEGVIQTPSSSVVSTSETSFVFLLFFLPSPSPPDDSFGLFLFTVLLPSKLQNALLCFED